MSTDKIYTANKIFTGHEWLHDHAIIVSDNIIKDVLPVTSLSQKDKAPYQAEFIVPAFIDAQIYGAGKKLFAVYPNPEALHLLNEYCEEGGAAFCMPTVATNTYEVMFACIDAVRDYWKQDGRGVLGLHLEGPWINELKKGAHVAALIHSPTIEQVKKLLDYGEGIIKIITLAPEVCSEEIIQLILSKNIIISAGHSNASYEQANNSFSSGISTVTHLYNAMSPLQHRAPGLVGASLDHDSVFASIIPDGYHVDFAAVRIAKKAMGERLFAITDAVTETTEGYYQHYYTNEKYEAGGILSGSALTMHKAFKNLMAGCDVAFEEALRMCSLYPAQVLKADDQLGRIKKDYKAALLMLDADKEIIKLVN
ncbi:MAG TPA: N-acetylglucosamine-6-phosphate deacetylase [Chitinophagaceae bacterium]|jgi:N-acetylglucosamine-6-phosphate deacetylase